VFISLSSDKNRILPLLVLPIVGLFIILLVVFINWHDCCDTRSVGQYSYSTPVPTSSTTSRIYEYTSAYQQPYGEHQTWYNTPTYVTGLQVGVWKSSDGQYNVS
jgi:hypothetical protein